MIHDFQQESPLPGVRFQFPATPWFFQGHRSIPAARCVSNKSCNTRPWLLLSRARYLVTNIHRGAPNNLGASKGHHAHYAPYLVGLEIVKGNPSNSEWFVKKEKWSTQAKLPQMVMICDNVILWIDDRVLVFGEDMWRYKIMNLNLYCTSIILYLD